MRALNIVIGPNTAHLNYSRRGIIISLPITPAGLPEAYSTMRRILRDIRSKRTNSTDPLNKKQPRAILRMLQTKRARYASACFSSKKPATRARHIGVEMEFTSPSSQRDIARSLAEAGLHSFVELKTDGSVSGGATDCDGSCREACQCHECGETHYCDSADECNRHTRTYGAIRETGTGRTATAWEYREDCQDCTDTESLDGCDCGGTNAQGESICLGEHIVCSGHCTGHYCGGYEDHPDYDCTCECTCTASGHEIAIVAPRKRITEIVRKVCSVLQEHSAEVNSTCGLHVHMDARGVDVNRMFANLVKAQPLLYSMVPASRSNSQYCQPNRAGYLRESYTGRYWGINPASYTEHGTIEVRLHSGSVNAEKVTRWIELLQKIAYAKSVKPLSCMSDLDSLKISPELRAYVISRVTKFASDNDRSFDFDLESQTNAAIAA